MTKQNILIIFLIFKATQKIYVAIWLGERFALGGLVGWRKLRICSKKLVGLVPRESSPVIINSHLLTKKLHLVCGRVPDLDVGLHL